MKIKWKPMIAERYCVDTGIPVAVSGDQCVKHGDARVMCYTALRDPRCKHCRLSPKHPYPRCVDCGNTGVVESDPVVG